MKKLILAVLAAVVAMILFYLFFRWEEQRIVNEDIPTISPTESVYVNPTLAPGETPDGKGGY